jgi:type IV pilus assembly protein PilW
MNHIAGRTRGTRLLHRGFTLVELMVALVISLGLIAALVTLTVRNSRSTAELEEAARQIENGRYALELLADELSLAGYFGAMSLADANRTLTDPCASSIAALGWDIVGPRVPTALQGFGVSGTTPACFTGRRNGTGAVVIRRISTQTVAASAVTANNPHLQTPQCPSDPAATPFVLSDNKSQFTLRTLNCGAVTGANRYLSRGYFVADCDECDRDAIPTLKRFEFVDNAARITPLAEGIEELQFEYGFDTNDDGVPDQYLTHASGALGTPTGDWANVMAVRIWLIARTVEPTRGHVDEKTYSIGLYGQRGPYGDAYKRRVYTTLVRLNNPAGLRQ